MNKIMILFVFLILLIPIQANTQGVQEQITNFAVDIVVSEDSTITVTETIQYNFGDYDHHGIYREIPYKYTRQGTRYTTRYNVQSVTDENGSSYKYEESKSGGYVVLKIGDPDVYISGEHTYVLTYSVKRAINYFDDHDEVFWNVTGDEWEIPILNAEATITLPETLTASELQLACYTGAYGSTETDCVSDVATGGASTFVTKESLEAYEGMTVVVGFPKEVVIKPPFTQNLLDFLIDNWYFLIPVLVWIYFHRLWMTKGKDPKGRGTIVPQYEAPEGMNAGVMGSLWDEKADMRDISATIIGLAVKGYIKIKDLGKKNYEFIKLGELNSKNDNVEREVFNGLFGNGKIGGAVELKDLKNKFYKKLPNIKKAMYGSLVDNQYYLENPNTVRTKYVGIGSGILMISIFLFPGFSLVWTAAGAASGLIILIYGWIMPAKTKHGAEVKELVQGFKWFLSVTEEERLKFHNAPEKKPEQFEKHLPHAMALGVEKEWAKQFKDMYLESPSWYEGSSNVAFNAIVFTSMMSSMSSNMNSTMASKPSSAGGGSSGFGGGGFSGGGFGGGGGGSW
ncbi:DUF2207 domain-containing protein [Patescibacteria group bacterium]